MVPGVDNIGNFWPCVSPLLAFRILPDHLYLVEEVLSFNLVDRM